MKFDRTNSWHRNMASTVALSALISIATPVASWAGFFGDHPRYLHAITDLRTARNLLEKPEEGNVKADEDGAIAEIDRALDEIKKASADDWKEDFLPPKIDVGWHHHERLKEADRLLHKAIDDISQEEDNGAARGLRNRARHHLELAIASVDHAMADKSFDAHHGF
jgi:hypothetical protein